MLAGKKTGAGGDNGSLLAGTLDHGWYGEVTATDFISGDELAAEIGLTAGVSQHSDAGWLKFAYEGKVLYVAKRPFRRKISWSSLSAVDVVFGNKKILLNGRLYAVRLLKGRGDNLSSGPLDGFDVSITHGSEWNRLMYHVSGKPFQYSSNSLASEGISEGDWAQYSETELLTSTAVPKQACWGQENNGPYKILLGGEGVSRLGYTDANWTDYSTTWTFCWRPCLELIP